MTPRQVYYNGAAWHIARTSSHPRARIFVWVHPGRFPRPGQTWRLLWRFR